MLTRPPIRIVPSRPDIKLNPISRLNYAKLYTIEFNVMVRFIGEIHKNSWYDVTAAFNDIHRPTEAYEGAQLNNLDPIDNPSYSLPNFSSVRQNIGTSNLAFNTTTKTEPEKPRDNKQLEIGFEEDMKDSDEPKLTQKQKSGENSLETTPEILKRGANETTDARVTRTEKENFRWNNPPDLPTFQGALLASESSNSTGSNSENGDISLFDQSDQGILSSKTDPSIKDNTSLGEQGRASRKIPADEDDIDGRSIASAEDDINSQSARVITAETVAAEQQLGLKLAHKEELKPLFERAIHGRFKNGREGFVKNIHRLLKWYHIDLYHAARTNLETSSAELIRSRGGRLRIARHISDIISPTEEVNLELRIKNIEKGDFLRNWLEGNQAFEQGTLPVDVLEVSSDSDSDDDGKTPQTITKFEMVETFMLEGKSFQRLLTRLQMWLLPTSLSSLNRVLLTIPSNDITLSKNNDYSVSNLFKILIESITEDDWHWWPLRRKMRMLKRGETRINWKCVRELVYN